MKSLKFIEKSRWNKFVIFSKSLNGVKAIKNTTKFDHIIQSMQESLKKLKDMGKKIIFFCIPSHREIEGNEKIDAIAHLPVNCLNPINQLKRNLTTLESFLVKLLQKSGIISGNHLESQNSMKLEMMFLKKNK